MRKPCFATILLIINYDIRNQALHFNNRAVNFHLDFSFLCRLIWWNATVSPFPLVLILFGGTAFPLDYTTARQVLITKPKQLIHMNI